MRWLNAKSSAVPTQLQLLRLVYVGRMCLATAIYVTAALKIRVAAPLDILATSLMLVTATGVALASYWHTHFRRRLPGPTFLYLQALFDVLLITAVVHITGGAESDLASLYVILIAVTALLMPPANAGLVTLFAGLVYFADVFWGHSAGVTAGIWIQLGVFVLVAVVTAYVASRVNVMGAEREALAAEVRQVQLEADDVLRNLRTGVLTVDADVRAAGARVLGGGDVHRAARRAVDARRGDRTPSRPQLPDRCHDDHARWSCRRPAPRFGDRKSVV